MYTQKMFKPHFASPCPNSFILPQLMLCSFAFFFELLGLPDMDHVIVQLAQTAQLIFLADSLCVLVSNILCYVM